MRLRWVYPLAITLVTLRPLSSTNVVELTQSCNSDGLDEEICGHTSLLQTSFKTEAISAPIAHVSTSGHRHHHQRRELTGHARAKVVLAHASSLTSAHGSREDAQDHTIFYLAIATLVICIVALFACVRRDDPLSARSMLFEGTPRGITPLPPDVEVRRPGSFDEDVYMMAVALIARHWQSLSKGVSNRTLHCFRIGWSMGLLLMTLGLQISLLMCTKVFVTPQAVASIRDSYDAYEIHMYAKHTRELYTGKHRGNPGFFNASLFESFPDDKKGEVCQIPFSQLKFLVLILLIWTVTCVSQISRCFSYMYKLLWALPTISSMADAIDHEKPGKPMRKRLIVGLTVTAKLAILFVVFLPWLAATCYLCWLGCRWLAATNSFGDFVANGMALEFILQFKELLYYAVCSERAKRDVRCTRHSPATKLEPASYVVYFSSVLWGLVAAAWVYAYIFHLQQVLPEYQWDVHAPCTPYLAGQLRPDSG